MYYKFDVKKKEEDEQEKNNMVTRGYTWSIGKNSFFVDISLKI